jgi:tetratricopeptide (TPR) repeat protein
VITVTVAAVYDRRRSLRAAPTSEIARFRRDLSPAAPFVAEIPLKFPGRVTLSVRTRDGRELIRYTPRPPKHQPAPAPATEPPAPSAVVSSDELYLTGLHLEQYRHATRAPEAYWREALQRDPGESRCHLALGRWHLRRGELREAEKHLRASVARLTVRNPNPADGEAHYQLGRCLRALEVGVASRLDQDEGGSARDYLTEAYAAFAKATWNEAWQAAAWHALAEIDLIRGDNDAAHDHLQRALRANPDHLRARNLQVIVLRRLGRAGDATALLRETLAADPLDWWARWLAGRALDCDNQVRLDLALDHARAGLYQEALAVLATAPGPQPSGRTLPDGSLGTAPLIHYYRAWLLDRLGQGPAARRTRQTAAAAAPDYCFPARLEEIAILQHALAANPRDARASFYLGNLFYDRRRHREAIALWQRAVRLEPRNAVAWRNLGIGAFNVLRRPALARRAYDRAFRAEPRNARLLYERDQLWKRLGVSPSRRLRELSRRSRLVAERDDLTLEYCALLNLAGRHDEALALLGRRQFHPWEGGEGQALGQFVAALVGRARAALRRLDFVRAIECCRLALKPPGNLGETWHLLANRSQLHLLLGDALAGSGDPAAAQEAWRQAAEFRGDFQDMSVRAYSEMTLHSARALTRLGRAPEAARLLRGLLAHARALAKAPARIDYFATSLPTMLLFEDNLTARQVNTALFLEAQARLGLGQTARARRLLRDVLKRDPNHALATELLGR